MMSVVTFQCPQCGAPLRLENRRLFVGRTFDCPDCGRSLHLEADGGTGVVARLLEDSTPHSAAAETVHGLAGLRNRVASVGKNLLRRPERIGWLVAAVFAIGLFWMTRAPREAAEYVAVDRDPVELVAEPTSENKAALSVDHPVSMPIETAESKVVEKSAEQPAAPEVPTVKIVEVARVDDQPNPKLPEPKAAEIDQPADDGLVKLPPLPAADDKPAPEVPGRLNAEQVASRLNQKIKRFDQSEPVAFVKLLDVLEELAAVNIVWDIDRLDDEHLQRPVSFVLEQTTVKAILEAATQQAKLTFRAADGQILLEPASAH